MSEFEQGLANIMGNFIETELDCVEKQNQEIEQLQQENQQLKEVIEKVREYIRDGYVEVLKYHDEPSETTSYEIVTVDLLQILDKGVKDE